MKPTKRQKQILYTMMQGVPLVVQHTDQGKQYWLEGVEVVRADVVERMLQAGLIRGKEAAMFGVSQSYEAVL